MEDRLLQKRTTDHNEIAHISKMHFGCVLTCNYKLPLMTAKILDRTECQLDVPFKDQNKTGGKYASFRFQIYKCWMLDMLIELLLSLRARQIS